jgi:putative addiction module component (TIGR02574 family)
LPEHGIRVIFYAVSDLRNQVKALSTEEKADLLDAVWESLEADALSLTEAQRAELDRRIERHEQNPSDVIPWEQVRAGLFKKP